MILIEDYLKEFKDAGISIQITLDIGRPITVYAFDRNGELHMAESDVLIYALEEIKNKLIK